MKANSPADTIAWAIISTLILIVLIVGAYALLEPAIHALVKRLKTGKKSL